MAQRYRKLDPRCWDDERFVEWDDGKRNLWLLLLLGPSVEVVPGLQTGGVGSLTETLRRPYETVSKQFTELLEDGRVQLDERFRLIRVIRAPNYNQPSNPNQVLGWHTSWTSLPESPLKYLHIASLKEACELADSEYVPPTPKAKRGRKPAVGPTSRTPFMDAFSKRFGIIDVEAKLARLNGIDPTTGIVLPTVHQTHPKRLLPTVVQTVSPTVTEAMCEPLGDRARPREGARACDDLDLDLGSGDRSGAGAGVYISENLQSADSGSPPPASIPTPVPPESDPGPEAPAPLEPPSPEPEPDPEPVAPEPEPEPAAPETEPKRRARRKAPAGEPTAEAGAEASDPEAPSFSLKPDTPEPDIGPEKNKRPLHPSWAPNDEHRKIAIEEGRDIKRELLKFKDDATAKRKKFVNWDAAFRNWLRSEFGRDKPGNGNGGVRRVQEEPDWSPKSSPRFDQSLKSGSEDKF